MTTAGIHAPSVNLETTTTSGHDARWPRSRRALIASRARQSRLAQPEVVDDHARLGQREPGEHAEGVQRDQGRDVAAEDDDQHAGEQGQER